MTEKANDIEALPGVGSATAEKLREAGYRGVESIAVAAVGELMDATGMGESICKKLIKYAGDSCEMGFETANQLMEKRASVGRITTGSKALDELLGGGIETRSISEFYGRFGSAKTQVALQVCINAQLPVEQGGLGGGALYIDTEGAFRPERVRQMAEAAGLDQTEALEKIFIARAFNSDHQMLLAEKASDMIEENDIKLVVVDSLTSAFRAEYVGRGTLAGRQQKLNRHLHALQRLADLNNLAIIVTNQVMANPGLLFGDPTTPIGGHIVGHQSTYRVYLRNSQGEKRIARLVDSPCLADGEVVFKVTGKGIEDA
ncbi:MAG: DNA repair and recombination protein RadA [Candidatus Diapherotrites archaeon]|nr:DNA repair and recombination protein RadA [Candidatus Diapherotrites archaeon]